MFRPASLDIRLVRHRHTALMSAIYHGWNAARAGAREASQTQIPPPGIEPGSSA